MKTKEKNFNAEAKAIDSFDIGATGKRILKILLYEGEPLTQKTLCEIIGTYSANMDQAMKRLIKKN